MIELKKVLTVKELQKYLNRFDDDTVICLKHDDSDSIFASYILTHAKKQEYIDNDFKKQEGNILIIE